MNTNESANAARTSNRSGRDRRGGFALPVAILALTVVGVLVTGGFYSASQETRIGDATRRSAEALALAEHGANEVMRTWDQPTVLQWAVWQDDTISGTAESGGYRVIRRRVSESLFFLDARGTVTEGGRYAGATRRVGMMLRIIKPSLAPEAALKTRGQIQVGGSTQIHGSDDAPTEWGADCGALQDTLPGIATDDTTQISYSGNDHEIDGDPRVQQDTTISDDDFTEFGDLNWQDLVDLASKTLADGANVNQQIAPALDGAGRCDQSVQTNWGAPTDSTHACYNYFPVIYAEGDATLGGGGNGQGILLVEGNLSVSGGFVFYGPVIVQGVLKTTGTGGHFRGGVMASNVDLETSQVLGNAVVQFSSCAVERAVLNNSDLTRARPVYYRSWVDLSALDDS